MAAACNPHRFKRGRLIERRSLRGPPIDQQPLLIFIREPNTADVAGARLFNDRLALAPLNVLATVDAPENQTMLNGFQLSDPVLVQGGKRVTF